jgi:hypothetical protein
MQPTDRSRHLSVSASSGTRPSRSLTLAEEQPGRSGIAVRQGSSIVLPTLVLPTLPRGRSESFESTLASRVRAAASSLRAAFQGRVALLRLPSRTISGAKDFHGVWQRQQQLRQWGSMQPVDAKQLMGLQGPRDLLLMDGGPEGRRRYTRILPARLLGDAPADPGGNMSRWFIASRKPYYGKRTLSYRALAQGDVVFRLDLGKARGIAAILIEGGCAHTLRTPTEDIGRIQLAPDADVSRLMPDRLDAYPARTALAPFVELCLSKPCSDLVLDYAAAPDPVSVWRLPALFPGDVVRLTNGESDGSFEEVEFLRYRPLHDGSYTAHFDARRLELGPDRSAEHFRVVATLLSSNVSPDGVLAVSMTFDSVERAWAGGALPPPMDSTPRKHFLRPEPQPQRAEAPARQEALLPARRLLDVNRPPRAGDRVWVGSEAFQFDAIRTLVDSKEGGGVVVTLLRRADDLAEEELLDFDPTRDRLEVEDTGTGGA